MTAPFEIACYRPHVIQIAASVYETMLGLAIRPYDGEVRDLPGSFTGAVYYAGSWQGAILLECSAEQAQNWAATLMSLSPPISDDDARDGLGELTNVIAGNLKPFLPPGVGLSIPSVVVGTDYSLRIIGNNLFESIAFEDESGPFRVTLVEVLDKSN